MVIVPVGNTSNLPNITYIPSKTKALKFADKINSVAKPNPVSFPEKTVKLPQDAMETIPNTKVSSNLKSTNSFEFKPENINSESISGIKAPKTKTVVAEKFKLQIDKAYSNVEENSLSFVDSFPDENLKSSAPKKNVPLGINDIKKLSLKKFISGEITNNFKNPRSQEILFNQLDETMSITDIFKEDKNEVYSKLLSKSLNGLVNKLIDNAETAESNLDLSIEGSGRVELELFIELKEIVTELEQELKKVQKQVEEDKKEGKVEIKIKRYDYLRKEKV